MKHCVPDWKMEDESRPFHDLLPASNQKRYIGQDNDLIELLWENGHVVLHNQTNYRPSVAVVESKQAQKPETLLKWGASVENSRNLIQEDETASWLQSSLDDPLDGEFSEFFCDMLNPDPHVNDKSNEGEKCCVVFSSMEDSDACSKLSTLHPQHGTMLPPKPLAFASAKHLSSLGSGDVLSSSHHRKSRSAEMGAAIRNFGGFASGGETVVRIGESSSMGTMESSICGGSHDQNQVEASHASSNGRAMKDSQVGSAENCRQANAFDPTAASSSGGSGCSLGRVGQESKTTHGHKRKGRDVEESDCHIEDVEQQQIEENKYAQRTPPSRRSRAAEVHNLSERRRRDRINEKMRALQELIPHCNKSDKASMLEEAIEYLKSLQLQVQIMWMGSGMAPMMLPQYMSHMGIGMGHPPLASAPSSVQLSGSILMNDSILPISMPNQQLPFSSPGLNPLNLPNPLPGIHLPAPFSHCLGFFPHMQLPNQVMGMYAYGSQVMHQNQTTTTVDCSPIPAAGAPSENIQTG